MVVGIWRLASFIRQSQLITVGLIRRSRLSINTVVLMRPRGSSSCHYYRIIIVSLDRDAWLYYIRLREDWKAGTSLINLRLCRSPLTAHLSMTLDLS